MRRSYAPRFFLFLIVCLAGGSVGCEQGANEDAEALPQIAGSYALVAGLETSGCHPPTYGFEDLYAFMNIADNLALTTLAVLSQSETEVTATLDPSDCVLTGSVGVSGGITLQGPCDDDLYNRQLRVTGTIAELEGRWRLSSSLAVEVDSGDGAGGAPDGTADCSDGLSLGGTGPGTS